MFGLGTTVPERFGMKISLLSTNNGLRSNSLKRIATELSARLGYKVWRTTNRRADRKQFLYGDMVDKLQQYRWFQQKGLSALEFTVNKAEAQQWVNAGNTVFARRTLTGQAGTGIVVVEPGEILPLAPVYTKYKKKKREFRVHIFKDNVVGIVEKKKRNDWQGPSNPKIRNLENGYVFAQELELTAGLRTKLENAAVAAAKVTKSDFRGVDVGYNEYNDDVFIIEVNSAPGIEGSNVQKYVEVIRQHV
jgi:hypothetical protein